VNGAFTPIAATTDHYAEILAALDRFWPADRPAPMHHPMFVREFAGLSLVIVDGGEVVAYLLGLLATAEPTAYVHVVGVRDDHRRRGLAATLYDAFAARAGRLGATHLKAITRPANTGSVAYHEAVGFTTAVDPDYSGPGEARLVFTRPIR
jgi:ribosomal protein S18 acetylase RimI-like enzyme